MTTPIYYVNGKPHLGHAACTLAADTVARLHRNAGRRVFFQTGTDEHGIHVQRTAEGLGLHPQALADRNAEIFRQTWAALDVVPDRFLRTTERAHKKAARHLFNRLAEKDQLFADRYEGFYCGPCEAFVPEDELEDGGTCAVHRLPCEWLSEQNTFLGLRRRASFLRGLIAETDFVQPASFRAEVLAWIDRGLPDLSLTRANVNWGIPVPGSPEQVLYVFGVDALTNYLTGLDYPDEDGPWVQGFPKSVHVIGKEILRFHALYWPALLEAAGLPLPTGLQVHGHFTVEGRKISKTAGNGIDPLELANEVGPDALRVFLLRAKPFDRDGDFGKARAIELWNAEFSGGLGNWAQRVTTLLVKHRGGRRSPLPGALRGEDRDLLNRATQLAASADDETGHFRFDRALATLSELVGEANRHLERVQPWRLTDPTDPKAAARFDECLETHVQTLLLAVRAAAPFTPRAAALLGDRLGPVVRTGPPVYPRL